MEINTLLWVILALGAFITILNFWIFYLVYNFEVYVEKQFLILKDIFKDQELLLKDIKKNTENI
jgi:hypothetical protein